MKLCVIPGDGIGQEVIPAAVTVLQAVCPQLELVSARAGWDCFQACGTSVPQETLDAIRACGAALFGAVSSPSRKVTGYRSAVLVMRQSLDLYLNVRPIFSLPGVSPRTDVDFVIFRENSEGLYTGREHLEGLAGETAIAERVITRRASQRLARRAAELMRAEQRQRLTIVHKANILPLTDGLFRDSVRQVLADEAAIQMDELLVDAAALRLITTPTDFQALITTNLFGDILSDEASFWMGGMGLAPSLNLGDGIALAEPVHGSAPDIAGQGIANPIAAILSAALLLRYHWQERAAAERIQRAVCAALAGPLAGVSGPNPRSTGEITRAVLDHLD
jgi:homoisocitrate dehydrogenase